MKILILLRHAKTEQNRDIDDMGRHITKEGINEIKKMGVFFKGLNIKPDFVLCSNSIRTKETLEYFMKSSGIKPEIIYEKFVYDNNEKTIISNLSIVNKSVRKLLIVGHFPSVENMVKILAGSSIPGGKFETSAIAVLKFDTDSWNDIMTKKGKMEIYKSPDMLN